LSKGFELKHPAPFSSATIPPVNSRNLKCDLNQNLCSQVLANQCFLQIKAGPLSKGFEFAKGSPPN